MLSKSLQTDIEQWAQKYPPERRQSAVIPALLLAQKANGGWLSEDIIRAVARYLGIPEIAALEVATFYSMYELKPVGRNTIAICTNVSCMLNGSDALVKHVCHRTKASLGETTRDGKFTLRSVECLGACVGAPACQINEQYYERMTPELIDQLMEQLP